MNVTVFCSFKPLDKRVSHLYFFAMLFIKRVNLDQLLKSLTGEYSVYVPRSMGDGTGYSLLGESDTNYEIGEIRSFDPLKSFYFLGREKVAEDFKSDIIRDDKPPCIVGAKACDLKGFKILDFVFIDDEYGDPTYMKAREKGLIISADCTGSGETCFCTAVDINPWPESDFDLNLSPVEDGFTVTIGSDKGSDLIDRNKGLFTEATEAQAEETNQNRSTVKSDVEKSAKELRIPVPDRLRRVIKKKYESNIWKDASEDCVECGACNTICPTCHCFLLYDQKSDGNLARFRIWDSCMIKDFARVAGGENPRDRLWMRLRNRFDKKFDYFPEVLKEIGCTGCGRCIAACPGKIDIREVLARLEV